jgi:hypothetical protein
MRWWRRCSDQDMGTDLPGPVSVATLFSMVARVMTQGKATQGL